MPSAILNTARTLYAENEAQTMRKAVGQAVRAHFSAAVHPTNIIGKAFGFGSFAHTLARRNIGEPTYEPGGIKNFYKSNIKDKSAKLKDETDSHRTARRAVSTGREAEVTIQKLAKIDRNTTRTNDILSGQLKLQEKQFDRMKNEAAFSEENATELGKMMSSLGVSPTGDTSSTNGIIKKTDPLGGLAGILGKDGAAMASGIAGGLVGAVGGVAAMGLAPVAGIVALGTLVGGAIGYGLDHLFNNGKSELAKTIDKHVMGPLGNMLDNIFTFIGRNVVETLRNKDLNRWWDSTGFAHFIGANSFDRNLKNIRKNEESYSEYVARIKKSGQKPMSESGFRLWQEKKALRISNMLKGNDLNAPLTDSSGNVMFLPEEEKMHEKKLLEEWRAKYKTGPGGLFLKEGAPSWNDFRADRMKKLLKTIPASPKRTAVPTKPTQASMLPTAVPAGTAAAGALSISSTADMDGVNPLLLEKVKTLQTKFGRNLTIISGHRDSKRNANAGGAKHSQHLHGNAVDLKFNGTREETAELIQMASTMGFGGIGVYGPGNVHLDVGPRRAWGPSYRLASVPAWAKPAINAHLAGGSTMMAMASTDSYSEVAKSQATAAQAMDVPAATQLASAMATQRSAAALDTQVALNAPEAAGSTAITGGGAFLPTSGSGEASAAPGIQAATEGVDDIIAKILIAMGAVSQT